MQRPQFVDGEIYHIYNRGVEKRDVFLNQKDYFRFTHDLFEFNDTAPAQNIFYKLPFLQSYEVRLRKKQELVEILAFCLMPNHFHLLLRQKNERGVTEFMRKVGTGYTNYFNKKYERVGPLFQGKFKAILVNREAHFIYLPFYIHLNPLDLIAPQWRKSKIKNLKKAVQFLQTYRWSSYLDYIGKRNFPSVTQRDFISNFFGGPRQYQQETINWLKTLDFEKIDDFLLE